MFIYYNPPLEYKFNEGRNVCLLCSLLIPTNDLHQLQTGLVHNRTANNAIVYYFNNYWIKFSNKLK